MSKKIFLPEFHLELDPVMSMEKAQIFFENNLSIVGKVTRCLEDCKTLEVDVGGGITAKMSFAETTIYPIYREDSSLSPHVWSLLGEKIHAKIVKISNNEILLSRKSNMLEAIETLKNENIINLATVVGFSKLSIFFDIGAGVIGRSYGRNLSNIFYKHSTDLGLNKGDTVRVENLSFLEDEQHFELSRVACLPSPYEVLKQNDIVRCKIFDPVGDTYGIGYFASVYKNYFSGIVDSPSKKLQYGDEVLAIVKRITPKGIRLCFYRKI